MIAQLQEMFSRVRSKAREAERDQFQTYWELIRRIARGERLDESAIVDAALTAGRDAESLARDVELYHRRERLARELEAAPAKAREAEKLAQLIETKSRELAAIQQKLGGEIGELYEAKKLLEAQASVGQHKSELVATAPNPAHRARLDELTQKRRDLIAQKAPLIESARGNSIGSMGGALSGIESQLEQWRENRDPDARAHVKKLDEYAAGYRSQIKALEQQISAIEEQIAESYRESESVRNQMLIP